VQADVLWLTDPLSMQQYDADGLLRTWEPAEAGSIPAEYREDTYWGTRLLNVVAVVGADVTDPAAWSDLTGPAYRDGVAIPDPGFAGTAFGALGYFALADGYGLDFYRALQANGAVQVASPGEVVTGVAEGRFLAGMTLDATARDAIDKGSPIRMVWPSPGGIAVYSPIAVVDTAGDVGAAEAFVDYTLGKEGQEAIAATGWQPVRPDVAWQSEGPVVAPDWRAIYDRQADLLAGYRAIFGG
jgi:iron(III) transport system substrate-binding protein